MQHPHLAKDLEVFVTNCMNNPRSCSARVDEMRVLKLFVFFVPTMFSGILGSLVEISTVVSFSLLVCTQTYLEVCVVQRIVARSVLSPEFFLLSASVCVASFFSNPCLQGWATICSFVYMGSTRFVSSSLSYVAVSRSREKTSGTSLCLTSSSLFISATITERS